MSFGMPCFGLQENVLKKEFKKEKRSKHHPFLRKTHMHGGFSLLDQANITFVTSASRARSDLLDRGDTAKYS